MLYKLYKLIIGVVEMSIEKYKQYAKKRRNKSKIAKIYDEAIKIDNINKYGLLNGGVASDSFMNPYLYMCIIGNGYNDNNKIWFTSNMYEILFVSGNKGVTIYKSSERSIHNKCFTCGGCIEIFGKSFPFSGCRVYEQLEIDEIITMLINKNWRTFKNVNIDNPYNVKFLYAMKNRLIKSLEHNKIIHYSKTLDKYIEYGLWEHFYKNKE